MNSFEWVLNHIQEIVIVAAVIAAAFGRLLKFGAGSEKPGEPAERGTVRGQSAEIPDAARRIQEEIRRKIAERSAGQQSAPPVVYTPTLNQEPPRIEPTLAQGMASVLREKLERQMAEYRGRQETMAQERHAKLEIQARAEAAEQKSAALERDVARQSLSHPTMEQFPTARKITVGGSLVAGLREAGSLRRAIVLNEIIGPPLALR